MQTYLATKEDCQVLANLNYQLIKDEGHRNPMTVEELKHRMSNWISSEYSAAVFTQDNQIIGYTLWRKEDEYTYIRQFFVSEPFRGKGNGKRIFELAKKLYWQEEKLRLDVLVNNLRGLAFWRSVGFGDYCLTMERANA